jgi:hypothetical protein
MSYHFKLAVYEHREEVFHEEDEPDFIYFVSQGEFEMVKSVTKNDFNQIKFRDVPLKV